MPPGSRKHKHKNNTIKYTWGIHSITRKRMKTHVKPKKRSKRSKKNEKNTISKDNMYILYNKNKESLKSCVYIYFCYVYHSHH